MKNDLVKKLYVLGIVVLLFGAVTLTFVRAPNYGIAAGNTIYVDASNTTPPWDGTPANPFQFIQDGIDNATYGDTVHVVQGTYNENLLINKSIALTGAGKPVINAGGKNAINVTLGGIVINNFNITNAYYGINVTIRDLKNLYDFTLVGGDIAITNNTIDASYAGIYFYVDEFGYGMHGNSNITIGDTRINHNTITSGGYGIYVDIEDIGSSLYDTSTFTMGNTDFCDNAITSDGTGIYVNYLYDIGYDLYNNTRFKMGHVRINNNTVTTNYYGIYTDYIEYVGYYLYNNAQFEMGNIEYNNNTINSLYEGILFWDIRYFGSSMYGNSSFTMGSFQVNNNHITSTDDGISVYGEFDYFGYYMRDTSVFTMGSIQFNNNTINSGYYGIEIGYMWDFGYYNDGNSTFTMGNIEFNNNHITSDSIGIYIDAIEDFGYNLEGNATVTVKDIQINNNQITCQDEGIYISALYYIGNDMYDNSRLSMGNIEISRNQIDSSGDAIVLYDIEDFGRFMYNQSSVTMGNFHVHDNTLTSNIGEGIYGYILDFQTHEYITGNATFKMGTVEFYNNQIGGSATGMYFTDLRNATIKQNTIQNCSVGINMGNSQDNAIYHNNFNNTVNALINGNSTWDNGYNGGNWWSDHVGIDLLSGPGQNLPDSDGISDAPYVINGTNIDHYPLMAPFHTFNAGTWGDVTYFVDIVTFSTIKNFTFDPYASPNPTLSFDVEGQTATSGFCRVTMSIDMMWCDTIGQWTVKVDGGIIPRNAIEYGNYTYIYFTYTHSAHSVEISSTHAVPEFASYLIISLLALVALLIGIMYRKGLTHNPITQK